jgi:hypothetical protein
MLVHGGKTKGGVSGDGRGGWSKSLKKKTARFSIKKSLKAHSIKNACYHSIENTL